mmetsp:Transcript_5188/g.15111  ORF Transcript_5188/g.15111 Transcript_5188/m.15111 type:complete len:162 (-) Transcript_5188:318-803(-)
MCLCKSNSSSTTEILNDHSLSSNAKMNSIADQNASNVFRHNLNGEGSDITIHEDETCYLLSIEMPGIHQNDLQITLEKNVLTISGYRRRSSTCHDDDGGCGEEERASFGRSHKRTKRQRLRRQLEIDPNAIDIERAMASTWNGCYTLYAPKRRPQFRDKML